jgi:hypothetical protein
LVKARLDEMDRLDTRIQTSPGQRGTICSKPEHVYQTRYNKRARQRIA